MPRRLKEWWRRVTSLWDALCELRDRGLAWLLRYARGLPPPIRLRARLGLEELEPRLVLDGNPVANNDAYRLLSGHVLTVGAPGVLANDVPANSDPLSAALMY